MFTNAARSVDGDIKLVIAAQASRPKTMTGLVTGRIFSKLSCPERDQIATWTRSGTF